MKWNKEFLTRAALILGSVTGVFGAALNGQVYPGGVAAPFLANYGQRSSMTAEFPAQPPSTLYVFAAYRPVAGSEQVVWSISTGDSTRALLTTDHIADLSSGWYQPLSRRDNCTDPVLHTYLSQGSTEAPTPAGRTVFRVGDYTGVPALPVGPFTGTQAEVLVYNRSLLATEQQRIESYLAIRHGITLDQSDPTHYLSAEGTVVWNAHDAADYNHRIFGLARDARSGLSKSEAHPADCTENPLTLRIQPTDTLDYYLTVSDNDGLLALGDRRLERVWRVQSTRTQTAAVDILLDQNELYTPLRQGNEWQLLVDKTGTARFDKVDTIRIANGTYRLPVIAGNYHFTFSPLRPLDEVLSPGFFRSLSVSPNPTTDGHFQLQAILADSAPVTVDVFDATGRRIRSHVRSTARAHRLNDRLPSAGLYLVNVRSGAESVSLKIVVQ